MSLVIALLLWAGCGGTIGMIEPLPCEIEDLTLARDEVSHLGFSADEVLAWYGDEDLVDVVWAGRHSRTPAADTFTVSLGDLLPEEGVTVSRYTPRPGEATADECALWDRMTVRRSATVSSDDGEVTGEGTLTFVLAALSLGETEVSGTFPGLTLADARWIEVDKAIDSHLPPPESVSLHLYRSSIEGVSITAEGPSYGVRVWNCNEQKKGDCATWR